MWTLKTPENFTETPPLTFRLTPGAVKTLGRATRADFIVEAALVSRFHCRFTVTDDGTCRWKTSKARTARSSTTSGSAAWRSSPATWSVPGASPSWSNACPELVEGPALSLSKGQA